jgi:hypothetical protein
MKKYTYLKIDEFQPYGYHMKVDVLHIVKKVEDNVGMRLMGSVLSSHKRCRI